MSIPLRGWRVADQKSKSFVGSKRTAGIANWITGGLNSSTNRNGRTGAAIQPKISIRSSLKIHLFGKRVLCIRCPNEYTKKTLHKSFHRCPCKHEDESDCELERECTSTAKNNLKDEQIALRWMNGVATESEATRRFPDIPGYQKCDTDIQESLRSVGDSEGEIRTASEKKFVNRTTLGKEGGVLGAIALVIGTSVGAGILALPAKTADAGFFPSAVILGVSWSFLVAEALIIAEVNVHVMNTFCKRSCFCTASEVISLRTMANYTLGPVGGFLAALIYLLLSYTLLIAYIAKAGEVVPILVHLPASIAGILFTFGFGGFIYLGGREYAQHMNTVLTAALIGLFLFIVAEGAVVGDWENLHHMDWQRVPGSIPVVLLALVYHDIIPVLCRSLDGDLKRIQTAIVVGSAVPVVMFLSWDAVALCIAPVSDNEDPIATFMRLGGTGPALAIKLFSLLALATSFIGSYLGLFEFYLEQLSGLLNSNASSSRPVSFQRPLKQDSATFVLEENLAEQRTETLCISSNCEMAETVGIGYGSSMSPVVNEKTLHLISFFLILVPPLVAANGIPDAFFSATDFAGAYGMTTLYGIFPPIMALSLDNAATNSRDSDNHKSATGAQMLGGKASLIGIEVCALAVILGQVILDFSNL